MDKQISEFFAVHKPTELFVSLLNTTVIRTGHHHVGFFIHYVYQVNAVVHRIHYAENVVHFVFFGCYLIITREVYEFSRKDIVSALLIEQFRAQANIVVIDEILHLLGITHKPHTAQEFPVQMITVNRLCIDIVKHLIDTFKLNTVPDIPVSGVGIEYLELISVIVDYCERTVGNEVDLANCRIVLVPQSRLDLVLFALVHIGKLCRRNRRIWWCMRAL